VGTTASGDSALMQPWVMHPGIRGGRVVDWQLGSLMNRVVYRRDVDMDGSP
jgi:hypothetical protein